MSDIPDALGTASEGGLFARAISRATGAGKAGPGNDLGGDPDESSCLNCGSDLIGSYCHTCGQKVHLHRTLKAVWHDLVHGVLHLDGKLWHTLPLLTLHPGKLTRRYIDGERAFFVSPMAMFLFTVFLMFAIFQAVGLSTPSDFGTDSAQSEDLRASLLETIEEAIEERNAAREALDSLPPDGPGRSEAADRLEDAQASLAALETANSYALGDNSKLTINLTGIDTIDKGIAEKWRKNPGLMLYKLQSNSYKFSWLLIPLSLPFVWLLFAWKRRFPAYDHAVFVTYSLSFMSLMFIAASLLGKSGIPVVWLLGIFTIIAPLHIYRQLKQTYGLSRWSTIWRLLVLLFAINFVIVMFLQILLLLGAF